MKIVLISTDESISGIGVRTLSSCLKEAGHDTAIVLMSTTDKSLRGFRWDDLGSLCRDAGLNGISCMTHGISKAQEVLAELRKRVQAPIIIGGIHASMVPGEVVRDFGMVCHGEGEDVIVQLAGCLAKNGSYDGIPGLWFQRGGVVTCNSSQPLRRDINDYPFPDYDLLHQFILEGARLIPMKPIEPHIAMESFVVMGSRGCPHCCTYCSNRHIKEEFPWLARVRHYSVDYLIRHLAAVVECFKDVRSFWIEDDTFFAKTKESIGEFCRRYRDEIQRPFMILISPWTFNEEKLRLVVDAGMNRLIMGIQSGSQRTNWDVYDRHISNERVIEVTQCLSKYAGMETYYDFIGMNPFETAEDLVNTIRFIRDLPLPFFVFNNSLAFYPGTVLYSKAVAAGWNITHRVAHSDSLIGYEILKRERHLRHKLLHLMLLCMAGKATKRQIGAVPRVFMTDRCLAWAAALDQKWPATTDGFIAFLGAMLFHGNWRRIGKRVLGGRMISKLRRGQSVLRGLMRRCGRASVAG